MTAVWIYRKDGERWYEFPYTVVSERPWPWGRIVTVTMTLRGARRAARRAAGRPYPRQIEVERVA